MAERINKGVRSAEEAERHARVLQEIEAHIEGMEDVRAARAPPPRPPAWVPLCSPGIVAMPTSTVVSTVCLHHVCQHLHFPSSTPISVLVSCGLTVSGGWMGCGLHWPGP